MNINNLETYKELYANTKFRHEYSGQKLPLHPFNGLGEIVNEETSYQEVIDHLGIPDADFFDDRGNRTLKYEKSGLSFKFLNNFNDGNNNPTVSFITIRKPFVDKFHSGIYPGLEKKQVYEKMGNLVPTEIRGMHETWTNDKSKCMKFCYDLTEKLESIIIF